MDTMKYHEACNLAVKCLSNDTSLPWFGDDKAEAIKALKSREDYNFKMALDSLDSILARLVKLYKENRIAAIACCNEVLDESGWLLKQVEDMAKG
jgi:hypothetical protein